MIEYNINTLGLPSNQYYAMEEKSFLTMQNFLSNVNIEQIESMLIKAGLSDDASKVGLPIQKVGSTAVLSVHGAIMKNDSMFLRFFGGTSTRALQQALSVALVDEDITNIVLHVDSGGGSTDGVLEVGNAIAEANNIKPVTAIIDGLGASAAFWIASQAGEVFATQSSLVGSIGVIMQMMNSKEFMAKQGLEPVIFATGIHKATGALGTDVTDEQREPINDIINSFFNDFISAVERGTGLGRQAIIDLQAGVFKADMAIEKGLINGIKSLEEVLAGSHEDVEEEDDNIMRRNRMRLSQAKFKSLKS